MMTSGILLGLLVTVARGTFEEPPIDTLCVKFARTPERVLRDDFLGRVKVGVRLRTLDRQVEIRWEARAAGARCSAGKPEKHLVDYWPTYFVFSGRDRRSFYVGGKQEERQVLERWTFDEPDLEAEGCKTRFTPPSLERTFLPVDPAMRRVASITADPFDPTGESVWMLELESDRLFRIDPRSGNRSLILDPKAVGPHRHVVIRHHSQYGKVVALYARPWFHRSCHFVYFHSSYRVFYDQDYDGCLDGMFDVEWKKLGESPLLASGKYLPPLWQE